MLASLFRSKNKAGVTPTPLERQYLCFSVPLLASLEEIKSVHLNISFF